MNGRILIMVALVTLLLGAGLACYDVVFTHKPFTPNDTSGALVSMA